jgi:hypothetical protein
LPLAVLVDTFGGSACLMLFTVFVGFFILSSAKPEMHAISTLAATKADTTVFSCFIAFSSFSLFFAGVPTPTSEQTLAFTIPEVNAETLESYAHS